MAAAFFPSMDRRLVIAVAASAVVCFTPLAAQEPAADEAAKPAVPVEMNDRERVFAEAMSNASLDGNFTITGQKEGDLPRLLSESYQLGEVRKVAEGKWLIPARIKYGDKDVTLPLTLPVDWAGDTAVIIVDKVGFPGLGTYSARVLIHDGRYAGYWAGDDHGGHLFGEVKKATQ
jgi:hypothetical protein